MGRIRIENDKFEQGIIICNFALVDVSGSMSEKGKEKAVRNGLKIIKESLMGMEDTSSTRVSIIEFGSEIGYSDLKCVETFSTNYRAKNQSTRLYDAIKFIRDEIFDLYEEYCIKKGYTFTINIFFLSDGEDNDSVISIETAANYIRELKIKVDPGIIIYDIGHNVAEIAKTLGIKVESCDDTRESIEEKTRELSQMLVESSQSGIPIGMELSQSQLSESAIASDQFKQAMASAKTVDMFDLMLDI